MEPEIMFNITKKREELKRKRKMNPENKIISKIESHVSAKYISEFYKRLKVSNGFIPRYALCKDKNGDILNRQNEIRNSWMMHFIQLFNIDQDHHENQKR